MDQWLRCLMYQHKDQSTEPQNPCDCRVGRQITYTFSVQKAEQAGKVY